MADYGIPAYFAGKVVLVTGATGSVGKAFVAKLLDSCPDIKTIYLIIRPSKKGESPQDRWEKTLDSKLFEKLRNETPEVLSKVVVLKGDNVLDNYGLSPEDIKVLEDNVNVIFHCAANINFMEELKNAVLTNMKSTFTLCEMAKKMKNFESFIHISTAYCNAHFNNGKTEEVIHPSPMDWRTLIAIAEDPRYTEELLVLEPRLMCGYLTTYTLTKAMAENIVEEYSQFFPSAIMRVSLVLGAMFEPEVGWTDTLNFLSAICMGVRAGAIRCALDNIDAYMPQIPLDICCRSIIIAPWYLHRKSTKAGSEVFCCRTDTANSYTTRDLKVYGSVMTHQIPWKFAPWYPFVVVTPHYWVFKILFILLHFLPGLLLDKILELRGMKPMLIKIYRFYWKLAPMMRANLRLNHDFSREKYLLLDRSLLPEDRKSFELVETNFNDKVTVFMKTGVHLCNFTSRGKEKFDDETVRNNRRRQKIQKAVHVILVIYIGFLLASAISFFYEDTVIAKTLYWTPTAFRYCMWTVISALMLRATVHV